MRQVKCIKGFPGLLTEGFIYTAFEHLDDEIHQHYEVVVDDQGKKGLYRADRFVDVLAPQVAPDFRQMQQIADDVKITCPVVEAATRSSGKPDEIVMSYRDFANLTKHLGKTDPKLAPDEWHLIFPDYRDLSLGQASKTAWGGGSNMTSTFVVKSKAAYDQLAAELKTAQERIVELERKLWMDKVSVELSKMKAGSIVKWNKEPGAVLYSHSKSLLLEDLVLINNSATPLFENDHVHRLGTFYNENTFVMQPQFLWIGHSNET